MDGAEVAVNCAWNVRSCPTCWCPDDELARTDKTSMRDWNSLPLAPCHAKPRCDAYSDFGEIHIAGYPRLSCVIPCFKWDILIHYPLFRAPITT